MDEDRRKHARIDVPSGLIDDVGMWAVNLSESGMALCSARTAFEVDATIVFTLALPSGVRKISARVVWCQRARSIADKGFAMGVEFVGLSRTTRREIRSYIDECCQR